MNPSSEFVRALDLATSLEPDQRFNTDNGCFLYRAAICELIWTMITTRPELSYPVVMLSQYASRPAFIYYDAVFGIFQYLSCTLNDGLAYTHTLTTTYGPIIKNAPLRSTPTDRVDEHIPNEGAWVTDICHRRFISGMVLFLSGTVVTRKTHVQPTVALKH
jgi:hypothetical protein